MALELNGDRLWNTTWKSFVFGLSLLLMITFYLLPVSLFMNRLIYHPWPFRLLFGILAGFTSVLGVVVGLVWKYRESSPQYFGLLPMFSAAEQAKGGGPAEGWTASLFQFLTLFKEPFLVDDMDSTYAANFEKAAGWLLLPEQPENPEDVKQMQLRDLSVRVRKGAVQEEFTLAAAAAAGLKDTAWAAAMEDLKPIGGFLYTN